mmetsp:Transcript_36477/g.88667  ORF Transcript_36477/g.88667 Transcript_36477/m.88667 type:complete len:363 (-) Transcript_36477:237-1325(-)
MKGREHTRVRCREAVSVGVAKGREDLGRNRGEVVGVRDGVSAPPLAYELGAVVGEDSYPVHAAHRRSKDDKVGPVLPVRDARNIAGRVVARRPRRPRGRVLEPRGVLGGTSEVDPPVGGRVHPRHVDPQVVPPHGAAVAETVAGVYGKGGGVAGRCHAVAHGPQKVEGREDRREKPALGEGGVDIDSVPRVAKRGAVKGSVHSVPARHGGVVGHHVLPRLRAMRGEVGGVAPPAVGDGARHEDVLAVVLDAYCAKRRLKRHVDGEEPVVPPRRAGVAEAVLGEDHKGEEPPRHHLVRHAGAEDHGGPGGAGAVARARRAPVGGGVVGVKGHAVRRRDGPRVDVDGEGAAGDRDGEAAGGGCD